MFDLWAVIKMLAEYPKGIAEYFRTFQNNISELLESKLFFFTGDILKWKHFNRFPFKCMTSKTSRSDSIFLIIFICIILFIYLF